LGTKDERREGAPRGEPGRSRRRDEVEDLRTSAGEDARLRLAELELRRIGLGAKLGEEGVRRRSSGYLGEDRPGDRGNGVFVAAWRDMRFSGCERRLASLFVCRAARGVLAFAPSAGFGEWLCIVTVSGRVGGTCLVVLSECLWSGLGGEGKARDMTMHGRVAARPKTGSTLTPPGPA
jgi:hypothetical protein